MITRKAIAWTAAAVLAAGGASATTYDPNNVTITVTDYSYADWQAYVNDPRFDSVRVVDFETLGATLGETELTIGAMTDAGLFARSGGLDGSGGSVIGTGTQVALREDGKGDFRQYGRFNTTPGGKFYLDTNDLSYMQWIIDPGPGVVFDSLIFVMIDAGDVGSRIGIEIDGIEKHWQWEADDGFGNTYDIPNGFAQLVRIDFGAIVSGTDSIRLGMSVDPENDGIGFDDFALGLSEVPLPAAGWLLLGGVAALGAFGRKRRA